MAVSSSSKLIQELHSAGLGCPVMANVDVLRPDMTWDLPKIEKSGVLTWEESWRGLGLSVTLSALSPLVPILLVPAFCTDLISELHSNTRLLSLAFRRLKQMRTRIRNALPPIANVMAVAMLIINLSPREDSLGAAIGNGIEFEDVAGH